jgi:hypothetical protein
MENIFRVHSLKLKYECVRYIHEESKKERSFLYDNSKEMWGYYFFLIRGFPPDIEEQKDSVSWVNSEEAVNVNQSGEFTVPFRGDLKPEGFVPVKPISKENPGELVEVEWMSKEEMDRYIERLNCTPEQALNEYKRLIRNIKFEKEIYVKCIDAELAKGDLSEYAKEFISPYDFLPPGWSLIPPPARLSKSDFLKVFKEFILNSNESVLPEGVRVVRYLSENE